MSTGTATGTISTPSAIHRQATRTAAAGAGRALLTFLTTAVIVTVLWELVLTIGDVSPYVGKGPVDVWNHLFASPQAADNRARLLAPLGITLLDSGIGFLAGMICAFVLAVLFRLSKSVQQTFMPFALLLRSVPLVAIAPVIILVFGVGTPASVAVIGGIVVLFPALVTIVFGLESTSPQMLDVVHVYGGSTWTAVLKVAVPSALPSIFAAIRISIPGAITGALLAEWLSTGTGLGGAIQQYIPQAKFADLWAAVVLITFVSLVLYSVAQLIESLVLARQAK